MALANRRQGSSVARPAQRPMAQAPAQRQQEMSSESGRFQPGLERRWAAAWSRARSGR